MSNEKEIYRAIKTINSKNLALLHCVSMYPCAYSKANLKRILVDVVIKDFDFLN